MQNRFGLLDTDVMPMLMIIALDVIIIMRFSINCLTVICSPTVIHAISEKPLVQPMSPGSFFHYIASIFHISECRLRLASLQSTILQSLLSNLYIKNTKNI